MVEEDRVVCIRFGHDYDQDCMAMDETLYGVSEKVQNFCVIYLGKSSLGLWCSSRVCVSGHWFAAFKDLWRSGRGEAQGADSGISLLPSWIGACGAQDIQIQPS